MSGDRIGYEANFDKARSMVAQHNNDFLTVVASWIEEMETVPGETVEEFRSRVVASMRRTSGRKI